MNNIKQSLIYSLVVFLSACVGMPSVSYRDVKEIVRDIKPVKLDCEQEAFYAHGVNSGVNKYSMSTKLADHCPIELKTDLNMSYKQGYQFGLQNSKKDNNIKDSSLQ